MTHSQPLAAPRLPGVIVDLGGIAISFGDGSVDVNPDGIAIGPGDGIVGSGGSRKCLALVKI